MTTTKESIAYTYQDWQSTAVGESAAFLNAMHSGDVFECDEEMFYHWLEVLPPAYMNKMVRFADGMVQSGCFGFVEGADYITAFWKKDGRFFGRRSSQMSRGH